MHNFLGTSVMNFEIFYRQKIGVFLRKYTKIDENNIGPLEKSFTHRMVGYINYIPDAF
jgi:hypothetical protein